MTAHEPSEHRSPEQALATLTTAIGGLSERMLRKAERARDQLQQLDSENTQLRLEIAELKKKVALLESATQRATQQIDKAIETVDGLDREISGHG